jgi:hypothetical protein
MKKYQKYIFPVILLLGITLRVADLDGRCFWVDEIESYEWGKMGLVSMVSFLIEHSPHLPLYPVVLHFWLKLGDSDSFARLLSLLFGVLSIYFAYKLISRICSKDVALVAAFFLAISPLHIMFSRIVREYALLSLLSAASIYYWLKCLQAEKNNSINWLKYGVVSLLLVYTHYYGWFIIIFQIIYLLCNREKHHLLKINIAITGIIFAVFLPWLSYHLPYLLSGKERLTTYFSSQFGLPVKILFFFYSFSLGETVYPFNLALVVPAALIFSIIFLTGLFKSVRLIIFYFFIPLLLGLAIPACAPRQLIIILPAFYIILACGALAYHDKVKRTIGILLISSFSAVSSLNYFTNREYLDLDMVTPWKEIVIDINTTAMTGDGIILGIIPGHRGFYHYYKEGLPVYVMGTENSSHQLSNLLGQHLRVWVLLAENPSLQETEKWMMENTNILHGKGYLYQEQTLKGLKEGFKNIHKYKSYLYKLYLCQRKD